MSKLMDAVSQFQGKSPDEIAAMLKQRKIKGRTGTTYGCPLAIALDSTSTGTYVIGRKYIVRRSGRKIEKLRTPEALSTFVRKFDIGDYPELIAPARRCLVKSARSPETRKGGDRHKIPYSKRAPHIIKNHIGKLVDRFNAQP